MKAKTGYGSGRVLLRGQVWWLDYFVRGKRFKESAGKDAADRDARCKLRDRLAEADASTFVGPAREKVMVANLLAD